MRRLCALLLALAALGAGPLRAGDEDPLRLPPLRALDPADFDRRADPCADPWRFANGGWLDRHPIPPGEAGVSLVGELRDRNDLVLRAILEEAAGKTDAPRGSADQLLGDFWCACMDTAAIERQGIAPISDMLGRVGAIVDLGDFRFVLVFAQLQGLPLFYSLRPGAADDDAAQLIPWLQQDGLGLPDPGAYLRGDAGSQRLREEYVGHVAAMLSLLGESPERAAADAAVVMQIETALAEHSMAEAEMRDPRATWHPVTLEESDAAYPGLRLSESLGRMGIGGRGLRVNLAQPDFFRELSRLILEAPLAELCTFLRWRVVQAGAPYLSSAFDAERRRFEGLLRAGAGESPPRWKRCVRAADEALGQTLGRAFAARVLPPPGAERAAKLVHGLREALRERLAAAPWMGEATRRAALEKLDGLAAKIGAPETWHQEPSLALHREAYAANVFAASELQMRLRLMRLGHPVDRDEWQVLPQSVDARYDPVLNEIVLPAGLLQPPLLSGTDDAADFGALGAIIGHELVHAFDERGAPFDKHGRLGDGWTAGELAEFRRRTAPLARQFDACVALDDLHVDGRLTQDENIADLAGLRLALEAFRATQAGGSQAPDASGFTPEQRFFLAWLQSWRSALRPEVLRLALREDPHAPAWLRATLPLRNMPEFGAAFGCTVGADAPGTRVEIW